MSRVSEKTPEGKMRAACDIRGGVRGKYYEEYRAGTNVVLLEQDVSAVFPDSASVNRALRLLVTLAQASAGPGGQAGQTRRSTRPRPRNGSATPKHSSGRGG